MGMQCALIGMIITDKIRPCYDMKSSRPISVSADRTSDRQPFRRW